MDNNDFTQMKDIMNQEDPPSTIMIDPMEEAKDVKVETPAVVKTSKHSGSQTIESETSTQNFSKMESKRLKSKLRSKKSRERKKMYVTELENRIKDLEKENFRLRNQIEAFRKQSFKDFNQETGEILEKVE